MRSQPPVTGSALMFVGGMDDGRVESALGAAGLSVLKPVDPVLFPPGTLDLAIFDPAAFGVNAVPGIRRAAEALGETPLLVLAGSSERATLVSLIELANTRAVVARDHVGSDAELARAIAALTRGPRFGLDAPADAPRLETQVGTSQDRQFVLERLADFASVNRVRRRLAAIVIDVAEELITNALYDAPTDPRGHRIYAEIDRRHAIFLAEEARPTVRATIAGGELVVSVQDPFGSLDVLTVKRYLAKGLLAGPDQVDGKRGGAGLGFARIFALVDRMEVHILPGVRTEVSLAVALTGARRDFASRPTGLVLAQSARPAPAPRPE